MAKERIKIILISRTHCVIGRGTHVLVELEVRIEPSRPRIGPSKPKVTLEVKLILTIDKQVNE